MLANGAVQSSTALVPPLYPPAAKVLDVPKLEPGAAPSLAVARSLNSVQLVPLKTSVLVLNGGVPRKTKELVLSPPVPDKPLLAVFKSHVSDHADPFQDSVFPLTVGSSPPIKRADV